MAVRMKDIAKDLNLSVVTISKVLRNHDDIGEKTRERVLARVKELNYRPNLAARSLVTGRSSLIGLVVPDLLHPFFAEVAKALSSALRKKGYSLIISSSEEDPELEEQEIDRLLGRQLDALVIASSRKSGEPFRSLEKRAIPYILIDREFVGFPSNFVGIDDEAAGVLATNHLIAVGCKQIAHIRGPEISPGIRRFEGYKKSLTQHGMQFRPEYVVAERTVDVQSRQQGAEGMKRLLSVQPPPDGVFCYNDPLAMGAIDAILKAGLSVPKDIAVIGCGNLHYDDSLRVPLSSIDQQSQTMGERAARLALSIIAAKTPPRRRKIILNPSLVVRASTDRAGNAYHPPETNRTKSE
jgi:LacI family transcriptional regulator